MKVQRLTAKDYDEMIELLNSVFTRKNGRIMDFEREMPKMCVRDDEHMGRHIGIFDNDSLVACMGIYPFDTRVGDKALRFATTGNIAVHPDHEGKGYMGMMMDEAMRELERLDVDVARLGGLRSRYNRYGFEACGQNYSFSFTDKNRLRRFAEYDTDITFSKIDRDDAEYIAFAAELYNKNAICVRRNEENAYLSMTMWCNIPYVALKNGEPIGYLCAGGSLCVIAEVFARDTVAFCEMICAWQRETSKNLVLTLYAYQTDLVRIFSAVSESSSISSPSHFKIRNWTDMIDAFMKLRASCSNMQSGELYIEISGYGRLRLYADRDKVGCERTNHSPEITLDELSAARYIFGPYPPIFTADGPTIASAWFPLPLSWNGQDRV